MESFLFKCDRNCDIIEIYVQDYAKNIIIITLFILLYPSGCKTLFLLAKGILEDSLLFIYG